MSAGSVKSSTRKRKTSGPIDRPFEPAVVKQAAKIAGSYRLILEPEEGLGFLGRSIELPYVMADGATADACVAATREAMTAAVATMLEAGQRPPVPLRQGARQTQVNIRLSLEEKLLVEESARRQGFRGVSDFVRAAALSQATGGMPVPSSTRGKGNQR